MLRRNESSHWPCNAILIDSVSHRVLFCSVFNLVATYVGSGGLSNAVSVLCEIVGDTTILSLVGTRMLIQLKETAEQNPGEGGSLRLPTHASTDVFRTISAREESAPAQSQEACLSLLLS